MQDQTPEAVISEYGLFPVVESEEALNNVLTEKFGEQAPTVEVLARVFIEDGIMGIVNNETYYKIWMLMQYDESESCRKVLRDKIKELQPRRNQEG